MNQYKMLAILGLMLEFFSNSAVHALTVEEFRRLVDQRIAVRTSIGLRAAAAISNKQIQVVFGVSVTPACAEPGAYRISSLQDPQYAALKYVKPLKAAVLREAEASIPADSALKRCERAIVTLDLPYEMKHDTEYFVIAQGDKGAMVTGGHTAQSFVYKGEGHGPSTHTDVDLAVLGLRQVESAGPGLLRLEFGSNFSTAGAAKLENYSITLNGKPATIKNWGRHTLVDSYLPEGWPFKPLLYHEIFLELEQRWQEGDKLGVRVNDQITLAAQQAELIFQSKTSITRSIKVNQAGYLPDSPAKCAYLGRWLGSFPELKNLSSACTKGPALYFTEPVSFKLCEESSGKAVFTGQAQLVHQSGEKNEGFYKVDHSGENVYVLDFSTFKEAGKYFIQIDGVGRSVGFEISSTVYAHPFEVQARGVFMQRCGFELKPPFSDWPRCACHNKGLEVTTQLHTDPLKKGDLPAHVVKKDGVTQVLKASGGHHDAGDYNPRSHLDVAQKLMDAYELAPQKFFDGQLQLPEQHNGVPDILDEAWWSLKLWLELQDSDGGVHHGTESDGDPDFITTVELDRTGDYAFAKDAAGSFQFAGAMAQASRIWRSLGKTQEADDLLTRAKKAYEWALQHPPATKDETALRNQYTDPQAYAAAQLLHTTGEARFNADFLKAAVWSKQPDAELDVHQKYDQAFAGWAYVRCNSKDTEAKMVESIRQAILRRADEFIQASSQMGYRFFRHRYSPINWGTGAYFNQAYVLLWASELTHDPKYREWVIRSCDNTLGANPMGLCYITGLGSRSVHAPLHNSRYSPLGEVASGQQVEGPVQSGDGYAVKETAYPPLQNDFAVLHTFVDCHFAIGMDEGLVGSQAQTMAIFGLLLPDHIAGK